MRDQNAHAITVTAQETEDGLYGNYANSSTGHTGGFFGPIFVTFPAPRHVKNYEFLQRNSSGSNELHSIGSSAPTSLLILLPHVTILARVKLHTKHK